MKRLLLFITLLLTITLSQGQAVYLMHGVKVLPENQALFEKIEIDYVAKIAQDAVNKGKIMNWILIKLDPMIGEADVGYNYVYVTGFADIDAMNDAGSWWSNSKAVVGVDPEILYRDLWETSGIYYYQQRMEIPPVAPFEYVIFNFGHANNIPGYLEGEKQWMAYHKKNMKTTGLTAWGVGTKFLPVDTNQTTNVMTWNGFKTRTQAMKVLSNVVTGDDSWPETDLANIMPDGWQTVVLGKILGATGPTQ
jgi:hypothetical protein|tara:strand:+ start:2835 stop:3584 length:750 start_codon:yes stop_codon:yes gene_type:complete